MVILQVMSCIEYGGTEAFVYNSCRQILREHDDCEIILFLCGTYINEKRKCEFEELGITIVQSLVPSIRNYHKIRKNLEQIKKNKEINVIHSHMNLGSMVVLHAAKSLGIPIRIAHSHDTAGYSDNLLRHGEQLIRRNIMIHDATRLLSCSRDAGIYLFGKKFEKKGFVIPNGIDVKELSDTDETYLETLRKQYNLEGKFLIGNITRFEEKKNQQYLVQVFAEVAAKKDDVLLILGGVDNGMERDIQELTEKLEISDKVRFIGARQDMKSWMQLLDIWAMPSLFEGLGIVLVEAQFSGVYCLASDGVSKEADMGYGLIEFLPLKEKRRWIERILELYEVLYNKEKKKLETLNKKSRYNICNSAKELYRVYQGNEEL